MERIFATTGNSLNVINNDGFTTLHIAAINNHLEIAKILLRKVISSKFVTFFSKNTLCVVSTVFMRFQRRSLLFNPIRSMTFCVSWDDNHKSLLLHLLSPCKNWEQELTFKASGSLQIIDCYKAYVYVLHRPSGPYQQTVIFVSRTLLNNASLVEMLLHHISHETSSECPLLTRGRH